MKIVRKAYCPAYSVILLHLKFLENDYTTEDSKSIKSALIHQQADSQIHTFEMTLFVFNLLSFVSRLENGGWKRMLWIKWYE